MVAEQAATIKELLQEIEQLERRLSKWRKNSSNSSKPPSSDIVKPIRIDEHRGLAYCCESCQKVHYAPLPPEVQKGGLFGPELTAVVAYMMGICHASFSTIRKFLRDVLGVTVSRGYPDLLKGEDALLRVARYDGDHCIGRSRAVMLDEPHQIAVMLEDSGFADETNIPRGQPGQVRA